MSKLTFDDEFDSLSLWNGSTGVWQPSYFWSPDGYAASDMSSWFVNPLYGPTSAADTNPYSIMNGNLDIAVMPAPADVGSAAVGGQSYVSGMLTTYPSFSQEYGYFEINARMSSAPGTMSAFWLLSTSGAWPPEIDIAEVLANEPTMLATTAHTSTLFSQEQGLTTVSNMTTGFNTYAVDWEPNTITWYFNGQQVYQIATPADMHQPMYIVVDTAAGTSGSWEGAPTSGSESGAMQINYVHVYSSDPYTATAAPAPVASANDTVVMAGSGGTITDSSGNDWTITSSGQVAVNAVPDATTANVVELATVNGTIWQENSSDLWWGKTSPAAAWAPGAGTSTSPLPPITVPASESSATISASGMAVSATSGNHMVYITGRADTVNLSGGTDTITDSGSGNIYVIPPASDGYDTFTTNILANGDTLDLRSALAATHWNGTASRVSKYLSVSDSSQGAVLSVAVRAGGAGVAIAMIDGATTTSLSGILAHALI